MSVLPPIVLTINSTALILDTSNADGESLVFISLVITTHSRVCILLSNSIWAVCKCHGGSSKGSQLQEYFGIDSIAPLCPHSRACIFSNSIWAVYKDYSGSSKGSQLQECFGIDNFELSATLSQTEAIFSKVCTLR